VHPLKWLWQLLLGDDNRPPEPDQLVVLAQPAGEALAGLWQSTLEAERIESMVRNVSSIAAYGAPEYELLVRYKDLERARRLLELDDEAGTG
jgi:hypothetical protein